MKDGKRDTKSWEKENLELWESELLATSYCGRNYKNVVYNSSSKICLIFFSSNGLYYPNTKEEFERVIIDQDQYEWERIAENELIKGYASKVIFIRDIYKQWYVKGINKTCSNLNALFELLRKLTEGYQVVTLGSSSGGYAAVLCGVKLYALKIYSLSGQFSIRNEVDDYFWLNKYKNDRKRACYYEIIDLVKESDIPIFYFYPAKCSQDIMQYDLIKNMTNVYGFAFDRDVHAKTMNSFDVPKLICMDACELKELCLEYKGILIDKENFHERILQAANGGSHELDGEKISIELPR